MGLYASYETITDEQISDFQQNPSSEFWEDFSPKIRFDLYKFWDVLHFVLTGSYTFYFESDNSELKWLHKAIIGDKTLNEHDFKDFDPKNMGDEIIEPILFNDVNDVKQISAVLNSVNINGKLNEHSFKNIDLEQLYPPYDSVEEIERCINDIIECFEGLKKFYQQAKEAELNVITNLG